MSLSPSLPGSIKTIKHFAKSKSNYCYEDTLFFTDAELHGEYVFFLGYIPQIIRVMQNL